MMGCLHSHARRTDPTRTLTIQDKYEAEMFRRFRKVKGLILQVVVKEDGFGLKTNRFRFTRSDQKISAFNEWLDQMQHEHVLGVSRGTPMSAAAESSWQNVYLDRGYQEGLGRTATQLRAAGATVEQRWLDAAFRRPIHADRVGIIHTRAYTELQGITQAVDQQISRTLSQGLAEGLNPRAIARRLNDRVDSIGVTRARTLARTEVINAHAEATLNGFVEAGVQGVEVESEWATAADPCPLCEELSSQGPYSIDEARGMIPAHPNCRCAWIPVVKNGTGIELR